MASQIQLPVKAGGTDDAAATDDRIDRFVELLRRVTQQSALDLALTVGSLVIDQFYEGRPESWRLRGRKDCSFRKLAARSDLPFSAAALYRSVAVYELWTRLPRVATWKHIGLSHLRTVLPLPPTDQEALLSLAESKGLSVRQLERKVSAMRAEGFERRGRPPLPRLVKNVRALDRMFDTLELSPRRNELRRLEPEFADELRVRLDKVRQICAELERQLPQ